MKELKGSKTLENLMAAFAGESMATNKYAYFASKAKKDGYNQIAAIFEETWATSASTRKCGISSLRAASARRRRT